jgi:hypothetical protein
MLMSGPSSIAIGLHAVILTVQDETPAVLVVRGSEDALPFGPFDPERHRTLETGLRVWVEAQTGLRPGYVEQLYTFGDRDRYKPARGDDGTHVVSVGYLALARQAEAPPMLEGARWEPWYRYFPWEDGRDGAPGLIAQSILPRLLAWRDARGLAAADRERRAERIRACFGGDDVAWDEEKVLERFELLYEAGIPAEALRDSGRAETADSRAFGRAMAFDHRRILATAMGRLRGKLKYRPVVFELMPPDFTLLQLQRTVEAVSGIRLHKQNFRRMVEQSGLVEPTGRFASFGAGRPAEQFRFRRAAVAERRVAGVGPVGRRRG